MGERLVLSRHFFNTFGAGNYLFSVPFDRIKGLQYHNYSLKYKGVEYKQIHIHKHSKSREQFCMHVCNSYYSSIHVHSFVMLCYVIILRRISDYGDALLVAFYDTLGIRRKYSRLKPRRPHGGT